MTRKWLAAIAAAGAFALAACSSGGAPDPGSSSGGDEAELGHLRVIQSVNKDYSAGGVDWAILENAWPEGLTVETVQGTSVAQALATGDADLTVGSVTRIMPPVLQDGLPVTLVGPTLDKWEQFFVVSTDWPSADSLADLKGARFGVTTFGSAGDLTVQAVAQAQGWTEGTDYTRQTLSDIGGLTAALQAGTIDAFAWGGPVPFQLQADGVANLLFGVGDELTWLPGGVIAVRNDVLQSRPAAVKAFCETYYAMNDLVLDDPDKAVAQFAEWQNISVDLAAEGYEYEKGLIATDSEMTDEQFDAIALGMKIQQEIDTDGATLRQYYVDCSTL